MMYAVITPEHRVDVYVGGGTYRETQFGSREQAEAALSFAGWVPTPYGDRWVPSTPAHPYTAESYVKDPVGEPWAVPEATNLRLVVVGMPHGFGFGFRFYQGDYHDPIIHMLTSGLITVRAIGTWSTEEGARIAGLTLVERLRELMGDRLFRTMLDVLEERWRPKPQEPSTATCPVGATGTTGPAGL